MLENRTDTRVKLAEASFPGSLQNSWSLFRILHYSIRQASLVHIDGQYQLPHVYAYLMARLHRVPYGLQPHGTMEPFQLAHHRWRKLLYTTLIGRSIVDHARYVLFTSDHEADVSMPMIRASQSVVAPLGPSKATPEVHNAVNDWLGDVPREHVVLFLGRLARKKNPDTLIEAWSKLRREDASWRLIIAGPDDEWTAAGLREIVSRLGVDETVLIPGPVTRSQASWLYERSGIFILPSVNENFALTIVEAMLSEAFTITTAAVFASKFVQEANGGTVLATPERTQITIALHNALKDASEQRAAGLRAQKWATRNVTWMEMIGAVTRHMRIQS